MLCARMMAIGGLTAQGASNMSYRLQVATVVLLMLWFFSFQVTWGPLAWVITSEVPPQQLREKTVTLSGFAAYGTGLVIVFVNPFVQDDIGGSVAFIYGSFSVLAAIFVYFFVPELRQRSLELNDEMFNESLLTREFSSYVCRLSGELPLEGKDEEDVDHIEHTGQILDSRLGELELSG